MPYPTSIDSFTTHINGDVIDPAYDNGQQTAIVALETKLGITGSADNTTVDFKLSGITGSNKAIGQTEAATVTNKKFSDTTTTIVAAADTTKGVQFAIAGTTGIIGFFATLFTTAKTLTFPDITDTVVTRTNTETLTNKTITTPTITKPVMNATNPTAQTYSPAGGATATLDLSLSNQHDITMPAGNITIALTNDTNNQLFSVSILQDATGSRTVTWFSTIRWANGTVPTLTTTANKRDMFVFKRTGSGTYDGFVVGQNV